jgi:hypothetical protein
MLSSQSVQEYVLQRRADRKSYRDIGTFREWACEQLHAADFDFEVPSLPSPSLLILYHLGFLQRQHIYSSMWYEDT